MSSSEKLPQFPKPYWLDLDLPKFDSLGQNISVDVAIVGAGITGITAGYLLVKEGLKVALLEADGVLKGTTGHTTAKLTAQHNVIYDELIQHFGEEKAKKYYESLMTAVQFVEQKGIDCDFSKQDSYVYATTDEYVAKLQKEWEAYQRLGIDGALKDSIPFDIPVKSALVMYNQAQYHPLKFLRGLLDEAVKEGLQVYEQTTAIDIKDDYSEPKVLTKKGHAVTCKKVIMASHFPFNDKIGGYFARMYPERSYAIGITTDMEYPGGMYVSADYPSRSIRFTPIGDSGEKLWIIGGENHKPGQGVNTMKHFEELEAFAKEKFGIKEYKYRWSAQDLTTLDKVPYIGPVTTERDNILVATGYKKWGMTTGILAGHLLRDYVLDRENPYHELYSPSRFHADPDVGRFLSTNLDVAKHLIKGKVEFVGEDADNLKAGQGAVVLYNGRRAGAYRDREGKLYVVDTTCTHMGCECEWNQAETTWDCPCHGSRYNYNGEVIEGPAGRSLDLLQEGSV